MRWLTLNFSAVTLLLYFNYLSSWLKECSHGTCAKKFSFYVFQRVSLLYCFIYATSCAHFTIFYDVIALFSKYSNIGKCFKSLHSKMSINTT